MQSCSIWKQWWSCFSSGDTNWDLSQGDRFYDTNSLAAQAAVLKDSRTSTRWMQPALKSQLFSVHGKTISEDPRMTIPGRPSQWGLQEAAGEGRKLKPGSGHSCWAQLQPNQLNAGLQHWCSKNSSAELWSQGAAESSLRWHEEDNSSGLSTHLRLLLVTGEVQQTPLPPVPHAQRLHSTQGS